MTWVISIVGAFISAMLAAIFVMWVENLRKPKLSIKIIPPINVPYVKSNSPAKSAKFLGLSVVNEKLPRFAGWLSRSVAIHCQGFLTFYHLDGQSVFGRSMQARWSDSPEPVPITGYISTLEGNWVQSKIEILDPMRLDPGIYRDIHPGESQGLDVVVRFDSDTDCYGWCNDNYFSKPPWRNPDWKLNPTRYLAKVDVVYAGEHCVDCFRLINDVPVNAFRLEKANAEDYKKIFQKT
ncbi:MAG: hypothetical protein V1767_01655 [Chloroflexota bacterium]